MKRVLSLTCANTLTLPNQFHLSRRTSSDVKCSVHQRKCMDDLPGPYKRQSSVTAFAKKAKNLVKLLSLQFSESKTSHERMKTVLHAQLHDVEEFGPIFRSEYVGLRRHVSVKTANSADVETLFRMESKLPNRGGLVVQQYYKKKTGKPPGLIFANGWDWYKSRHAVSKRILPPKEVADYIPALSEITDDFIERLKRLRGSPNVEHEIPDLDKELFNWSFESICRIVFGHRFRCFEDVPNSESQKFVSATRELLDSLPHLEVFPSWYYRFFPSKMYKTFTTSVDKLYEYTEVFISRKVDEVGRKGALAENDDDRGGPELLSYLLSSDLSKNEIMASLIDLLFAGVDTTSTAILWSLYLLGNNLDKQEKLYLEISTVLKEAENVTPQLFSKMPYLKATVKETLRLYPITFLTRVLEEDTVMSNYLIPSGTDVIVLLYAMSRDKKKFPNPSAFIPERWLQDKALGSNKNPFAFLPFGYGRRMCVGRRIAETEMYLLLTRLIQNFHISNVSQEVVEKSFHGIVTIPDRPIRVKLYDRNARN